MTLGHLHFVALWTCDMDNLNFPRRHHQLLAHHHWHMTLAQNKFVGISLGGMCRTTPWHMPGPCRISLCIRRVRFNTLHCHFAAASTVCDENHDKRRVPWVLISREKPRRRLFPPEEVLRRNSFSGENTSCQPSSSSNGNPRPCKFLARIISQIFTRWA